MAKGKNGRGKDTFRRVALEWLSTKEGKVKESSLSQYKTALLERILPKIGERKPLAKQRIFGLFHTGCKEISGHFSPQPQHQIHISSIPRRIFRRGIDLILCGHFSAFQGPAHRIVEQIVPGGKQIRYRTTGSKDCVVAE